MVIKLLFGKIPGFENFIPSKAFSSDSLRLKKVSDLFDHSSNSWDIDLVEQTFKPEEARQILSITLKKTGHSDLLTWLPHKQGKFTIKYAYSAILKTKMLSLKQPESSNSRLIEQKIWKTTWELKIKQKIKNFLWSCWFKFISTQDQLKKKCIQVDPICCICGKFEESLEHIFFHCDRASKVWKLSGLDWSGLQQHTDSFNSWWAGICHIQRVQCIQDRVHYSTYILWWLWKTRNNWLFNKVRISKMELAKRAWIEWTEFDEGTCSAS
ncbi:RNA-directed DNA polymerase (reversetranscriptase)-related family protein [Striga asiatica]|uniref:RNA-directed DNA polymerase (Reversetranscriptase)-related family protein n=1 Tax=Striga asiatica TaxID=4170 RepID=A0A5A7QH67_STRAF|nr:RNA-directed DNA polymerase (reversetranscriptase)-related family protein [Striga asiatica]